MRNALGLAVAVLFVGAFYEYGISAHFGILLLAGAGSYLAGVVSAERMAVSVADFEEEVEELRQGGPNA